MLSHDASRLAPAVGIRDDETCVFGRRRQVGLPRLVGGQSNLSGAMEGARRGSSRPARTERGPVLPGTPSPDGPTVPQISDAAQISRINAYDIAKRRAHRGLLSLIEGDGQSERLTAAHGWVFVPRIRNISRRRRSDALSSP